MAARVLVHAGWRVLLLERGGWVERGPENWAQENVGELTGHYSPGSPLPPARGAAATSAPTSASAGPRCSTAGSRSASASGISRWIATSSADSGARMAPQLRRPRAPLRHRRAHPRRVRRGGRGSHRAARAARRIPIPGGRSRAGHPADRSGRPRPGLSARSGFPSRSTGTGSDGRGVCQACGTCDGFACAVGAKNDLATTRDRSAAAAGAAAGDRTRSSPGS